MAQTTPSIPRPAPSASTRSRACCEPSSFERSLDAVENGSVPPTHICVCVQHLSLWGYDGRVTWRGQLWQRENRYPSFTERLPSSCTEQLPPAIPASFEVVQNWPKRCPKVVDKLPREPRIGPNSTQRGSLGQMLAELRQSAVKFQVVLVDVDQVWAESAKSGQVVASLGQNRPRLDECWPNLPQIGINLVSTGAKLGRCVAPQTTCFF